MTGEALWELPEPGGRPAGFALAVAADLQARELEARPVGAMGRAVLLALAEQIDSLSTWLARRPDAKPADRVALARLLAQFESTYERACGPVAAESGDELGDIIARFGAAASGHAA